MGLSEFVDIVHSGATKDWPSLNDKAFNSLFGTPDGRYSKACKEVVALRAPKSDPESSVLFSAIIHNENPTNGPYHGLSFVIFPSGEGPCLLGLVVGTDGLSPDEAILGRPGHARKAQAIAAWLNNRFGNGKLVAWAKQDPTRTDLAVPESVRLEWDVHKRAFDRYGKEMYAMYCPTEDRAATETAIAALLDLMFQERGYEPLASASAHSGSIRSQWFDHLMPRTSSNEVHSLLQARRYVILQGPPGTGKTKTAVDLLANQYLNFGRSIQFHPNTTYENFIGGLAPLHAGGELGLRFAPSIGFLMQAAAEAHNNPDRTYLLHIDEINRADLGKILGEAIFLLEASADVQRQVQLPYDFGPPFHSSFFLPSNLHILGTMNSADRSIALVDIAVRRRFAFASLWPSLRVVEELGCDLMKEAFQRLVSIFVEHASDDTISLVPGHSYFLESNADKARQSLRVHLVPLLEEYLAQGYVSGFSEQIRSYLQWLHALSDVRDNHRPQFDPL